MDYTVKQIPNNHTKEWLLKKHYAKRIPSISYAFGLFDKENVLQGVCTFGKPASNSLCIGVCGESNSHLVYELNRLCVNDGLPTNTLSFFVAQSLQILPTPLVVVSYADSGQNHHGYIYQATNWIYTGATKERTDIATAEGTHSRHYKKGGDYSNRKFRSSKHRYIMFLGDKRERKNLMSELNYEIQEYPKGNNKRYDASAEINVQIPLI